MKNRFQDTDCPITDALKRVFEIIIQIKSGRQARVFCKNSALIMLESLFKKRIQQGIDVRLNVFGVL